MAWEGQSTGILYVWGCGHEGRRCALAIFLFAVFVCWCATRHDMCVCACVVFVYARAVTLCSQVAVVSSEWMLKLETIEDSFFFKLVLCNTNSSEMTPWRCSLDHNAVRVPSRLLLAEACCCGAPDTSLALLACCTFLNTLHVPLLFPISASTNTRIIAWSLP